MTDLGLVAVGVTGHQDLSASTVGLLQRDLSALLTRFDPILGVTSLAAGADQLFAKLVLQRGGELYAVIPSAGYETSFTRAADRAAFRDLLKQATERVVLPYTEPTERAYWAAGREVVEHSDHLVAIWDGKPAGGLGGTADVVRYARDEGRDVHVVWPKGARRTSP